MEVDDSLFPLIGYRPPQQLHLVDQVLALRHLYLEGLHPYQDCIDVRSRQWH